MYFVILLTVISSLSTLFLAFQYQKEMYRDGRKTVKVIHVFISSLLMGAFGFILAFLSFNFQKENKRLVFIEVIILLIQISLIFFLSTRVI